MCYIRIKEFKIEFHIIDDLFSVVQDAILGDVFFGGTPADILHREAFIKFVGYTVPFETFE